MVGVVGLGHEVGEGDLEDGREPAQVATEARVARSFELGQEALAAPRRWPSRWGTEPRSSVAPAAGAQIGIGARCVQ